MSVQAPQGSTAEAGPLFPLVPQGVCRAHGATNVGHVRKHNEDQFLIANVTPALRIVEASIATPRVLFGEAPSTIFAVADGMGGHARGERASELALCSVEESILRALGRANARPFHEPEALLRSCFEAADLTLNKSGQLDAKSRGMGTTMTIAMLCGASVYFAHAGDSRAYMLRNNELRQLTRDHSVAAELERQGILDEEGVANSQFRHIVTNVVGGGKLGVEPDAFRIDGLVGDRFLLCSDGLTNELSDAAIVDIMNRFTNPKDAAEELVAAVLKGSAKDNVTALVISLDAPTN